ncbi:lysozyme inhibitor LprI family protein [Pantoea sp. B65]|uniref:lysozyme inhibitor LprI family protein n=1 Tax=Pantoea sp. B65 TaxID=2813359 RepID=UPI0039B6B9EC
MRVTNTLLLIVVFIYSAHASARMLDIEDTIDFCFTNLPSTFSNTDNCVSNENRISQDRLDKEIIRMKSIINKDYDGPFHLNDVEGEKISNVFLQQFARSQEAWEKAKKDLCEANANLMGEWATSHDISVMSCNIKMNNRRTEEIKLITESSNKKTIS